MSISENIAEMIERIHQEREELGMNGPLGVEVRTKAMNAILGGKEEWAVYVDLFAKDEQELARLIPTDGTDNDENKKIARAYLAANGMCAPGTGDGMLNNVTDNLNLP